LTRGCDGDAYPWSDGRPTHAYIRNYETAVIQDIVLRLRRGKMKIAIIGSRGYPYVYSGYETFVKELVERLVHRGYELTVYCHKTLFKDFPRQVNGVNLVYIPTIEKKSLSQFVHSIQSILHASFRSYDIILVVNSANGPFGLITKLFGKKTAINVDGLEWLRPKWKGLGSKYFYWASKVATRLFDVIITDSDEMRKVYEREFNAKSTVIAYGANLRVSRNPELIKQWDLQENGYYLIVGRLIPDNNADIILREFINSSSNRKLVIVGDVPYRDVYAMSIKNLKDQRIIFTGYVNDQDLLAELYHNCYAYMHGHEFGGTNPTMLKALAYGCAILALDTVFNREMLNNGENGIFFSKEIGKLTNLIHRIELNPDCLIELRNKAKQRIIDNYTWEKITDQYIHLFEGMMTNKTER
jgi:glycosyltransferase involved in cell wall biosynthesis